MGSPPIFGLDEYDEPLDMSGVTQPAQPQPQSDKAKWIKLALIAPLLAKGGPGAIEGFLAGLNRSNLQQQQQRRLDSVEAQRVTQQNQLQQYRQDALSQRTTNDQQLRQQALLKEGLDRLASASTPDELQAVLQTLRVQAQGIGMRPGVFDSYAAAQTPSSFQKKTAEKRIATLKSQQGEKWMEIGPRFTYDVGESEPISFQELLRRSGMTPDPNAPPVALGNTDKRGFATKDVTVNGKRMLAGFDPDKNQYFAPGDMTTPLTGDIQEYTPPPTPSRADPTQRQDTRVDRIVAAFNAHPIVKNYNEVKLQTGIVDRVVNGPWTGPGDMLAIFSFMKALDPNSVVRETEYDRASKAGNIFAGWAARFNGALSPSGGFLSDQVRRDFLSALKLRMAEQEGQYRNLRGQLAKRIDRIKAGAPETGDEALVEYETGAEKTPERPNANGRTRGAGASKPNPYRPSK